MSGEPKTQMEKWLYLNTIVYTIKYKIKQKSKVPGYQLEIFLILVNYLKLKHIIRSITKAIKEMTNKIKESLINIMEGHNPKPSKYWDGEVLQLILLPA